MKNLIKRLMIQKTPPPWMGLVETAVEIAVKTPVETPVSRGGLGWALERVLERLIERLMPPQIKLQMQVMILLGMQIKPQGRAPTLGGP